MFKFGKTSLRNLEGLHPDLVKFAYELLKKSPYDFTITAGVRTAEEQNLLYQQGRVIPGPIVTNCDGYNYKSNHQAKEDGYGHAFDIAVIVNKKYSWDAKYYIQIAKCSEEILKKYNIQWGGNWKNFKDYPHFQYANK